MRFPSTEARDLDLKPIEQALAAHAGAHWDEAAQRYVLGPRER